MPDYLEELRPVEPALMAELLHFFLVDAAASLERLTEQTSKADVVAIAGTLHTLKGSCGQMGGQTMSQLLQEMEERLKDGGVETTREFLPALTVAFQSLRRDIETWMLRTVETPPRG